MSGGHIVLVHGDTVMREFVFRVLQNAGHQVQCFGSMQSADSYLREGSWDLLLLHTRLPGTEGLALLWKGPAASYHASPLLLGACSSAAGGVLGAQAVLLNPAHVESLLMETELALQKAGSLRKGTSAGTREMERQMAAVEAQAREHVATAEQALAAERQKLRLDLHDRVIQGMVSALRYMEAIENLVSSRGLIGLSYLMMAKEALKQSLAESRNLLGMLSGNPRGTTHLMQGILAELHQLKGAGDLRVDYQVDYQVDPLPLTPEQETALYFIVREGMLNAARHSNCSRIKVAIRKVGEDAVAEVQDWGVGFDPAVLGDITQRRSGGLYSMRKRAELVGGTCEINTAPGEGTLIRVQIPVEN